MCDDKIYEYKLLDENLRKERENVLKNYLSSSNEEYDLDFFDLEIYKRNKNDIFNVLFKSQVNPEFFLTMEQYEILSIMEEDNLFLSAPTSFGKTFIVLEFIKRHAEDFKNIVFIVPTLALMNELLKKIYALFSKKFNICINGSENFEERNIFIFVPERSDSTFYEKVKNLEIDLLIMDEIYKLQGNASKIKKDDRLVLMNKTYLDLVLNSKKKFLLGPFISEVEFNNSKIDIVKYYTNYTLVYSEINYIDKEEWIKMIDVNSSQLIYFSSPESIYKNIPKLINNIDPSPKYEELYEEEIMYLSKKVYSEWYIIKLLKRGIGVHHGKTPMFLRKFYENEFNNGNLKLLLCTSTLMEGINTPTEKLIVYDEPDSAFELYNLIGRVARLNPTSPKIGQVYICDKSLESKYLDTNGWRKLEIVAEKEVADTVDEIIYFNTKPRDEKLSNEYQEYTSLFIEKYGITIDNFKTKNLKYSVMKKMYINDSVNKFLHAEDFQTCVSTAIDLLLNLSYEWEVKKFNELNIQKEYLPYKYYVTEILLGTSISDMINSFNLQYNTKLIRENIDLFIDKILNIEKSIKFKLSKIIDYLDVTNTDCHNNLYLRRFYNIVKTFNDDLVQYKILDDLGIEKNDCSKIIKYLNLSDEKISTSKLINAIKSKEQELMNQLESPFSKKNIRNL